MNVFEEGAVIDALDPVFECLIRRSSKFAKKFEFNDDEEEEELAGIIAERAVTSLRRLLLRIQSYGHGGAVLITPTIWKSHLNIKHGFSYPRLAEAIQKTSVLTAHRNEIRRELSELYEGDEMMMPILSHLTSAIIEDEFADAEDELNGSLWFVSLLSRIDGLVLMDASLAVKGFGVEILLSKAPDKDLITSNDGIGVWRIAGSGLGRTSMRALTLPASPRKSTTPYHRPVEGMVRITGDWVNIPPVYRKDRPAR